MGAWNTSRFEMIGIDFQLMSESIEEADYHFNISCRRCAYTGKRLLCHQCKIAVAYDLVISIFEKINDCT